MLILNYLQRPTWQIMYYKKLKTKRGGYLSLISIAIIVIIGAMGAMPASMLAGNTKSGENIFQVQTAVNLANSALQIAKTDINRNRSTCKDINGSAFYTNATLSGIFGQYTVDCAASVSSATLSSAVNDIATSITLNNVPITSALNGNINSTATSIPLTASASNVFPQGGTVKIEDEYISYMRAYYTASANILEGATRGVAGTTPAAHNSGVAVYYQNIFLDRGLVLIDNELISYSSISRNGSNTVLTLQNCTRGAFGTTAATHSAATAVRQNSMLLTATAGVPSLSDITGKRTIQESLFASDAYAKLSLTSDYVTYYQPTLIVNGTTALTSNSASSRPIIRNMSATNGGPYFSGSTLLTGNSGSGVRITSQAQTQFQGGTSTFTSNIGCGNTGDIQVGYTGLANPPKPMLFNQLFDFFDADLANRATKTITAANFYSQVNSSAPNDIVLVTGNLSLNTLTADLTVANPPKMIIIDGNLTSTNNNAARTLTIGSTTSPTVVYVTGNIYLGNSPNTGRSKTVIINGLLLTGSLTLTNNHSITVNGLTVINGNISDTNRVLNIIMDVPTISQLRYNNELLWKKQFASCGSKELLR